MHGQVDQHIDAVVADHAAERIVIERAHLAPRIRVSRDALGVGIGPLDARIAEYAKCAVVVLREQRQGEKSLAVVAKVRGDVTDVQASVGRQIAALVRREAAHRRGEARAPALAFRANGFGRRRLEAERVGEIAVRRRIAGIEIERAPKAVDRLIELARILEHVAEVVVQSGVAGIDCKSAAQHVLRLVGAPERAQQAAGVVQGGDDGRAGRAAPPRTPPSRRAKSPSSLRALPMLFKASAKSGTLIGSEPKERHGFARATEPAQGIAQH